MRTLLQRLRYPDTIKTPHARTTTADTFDQSKIQIAPLLRNIRPEHKERGQQVRTNALAHTNAANMNVLCTDVAKYSALPEMSLVDGEGNPMVMGTTRMKSCEGAEESTGGSKRSAH